MYKLNRKLIPASKNLDFKLAFKQKGAKWPNLGVKCPKKKLLITYVHLYMYLESAFVPSCKSRSNSKTVI